MRRQGDTARVKGASRPLGVAIATLALGCGTVARADVTPAGTLIRNIASASFSAESGDTSIKSNAVSTRVGELLDVRLTPKADGPIAIPANPAPGFGISFALSNSGNGTEAFSIEGAVPGAASGPSVAVDVDGNGIYDPAVDIDLPSGGRTPALPAGGRLDLIVRFTSPPTQDGIIQLTARAVTGTGTAGTLLAGIGDDGSDATVGKTDAAARAEQPFIMPSNHRDSDLATLTKSQAVMAPDGTETAMTGATITYRLELATTGREMLADAEIADRIPTGTRYVPGSIRLNGAATSDAADSDAALFDGAQIRVALGDLSQPTTQVVTFQVIIQ